MSGIPGTVGASVVQNIGAYGQEVATSVDSVEVWDRKERAVKALRNDQLAFGYRMSALKASMYSAPATPAAEFFPTPRYVVLSVTFALRHSDTGVVGYGQLAKALDVAVGDRMNTADIRNAVLKVRAAKGMLEDAHRYASPAMQGTKKTNLVDVALESQSKQNGDDGPDFNRHSCGSFFMNRFSRHGRPRRFPKTRRASTRHCRAVGRASRPPRPGSSTMPASIRGSKSTKTLRLACPRCIRWR